MSRNIAIISNSQTPYRLHLHRRIAAELRDIRLFSVYTHEISNSSWEFSAPPEIGPVLFGKGETCEDQDKLKRVGREWRRAGRIIGWMRENNIRFVVMMGYNDVGRMRMIRWCRQHHIPCFLFGDSNIHGDTRTGLRAMVKRLVVSRIVRSCAGILACGSLGRAYFAKYGADPARIFYFPYEPDYALLENISDDSVRATRLRFGLAEDRHRLVYSGRLIAHKRVDLLFAAFAAIADQRPLWDLVVIGDGLDRGRLAGMIPPALEKRVIWAGFLDDQAEVSAIYRASDILVLPSDFEPWALVINEAAAAGLAIVSSNVVGAAAEIVREGVNGRFFPPGNLKALTEVLLDITAPSEAARMKKESRQVLAQWRERGDPVQGLLQAIKSVGILPADCYRTTNLSVNPPLPQP